MDASLGGSNPPVLPPRGSLSEWCVFRAKLPKKRIREPACGSAFNARISEVCVLRITGKSHDVSERRH